MSEENIYKLDLKYPPDLSDLPSSSSESSNTQLAVAGVLGLGVLGYVYMKSKESSSKPVKTTSPSPQRRTAPIHTHIERPITPPPVMTPVMRTTEKMTIKKKLKTGFDDESQTNAFGML